MSDRFEPPVTDVSTPFWDATREKRITLQRCADCEAWVWYPRSACTACLGEDLRWTEVSGEGSVYAVSVHHRPGVAEMKGRVPFAVALVELREGVRMLTNIVGCDPESVRVGQKVSVAWEALSDGRNLPVFEPTGT
ncbi:MAG: OB-fold domain-containing protein [Gemmatimonadota bacterium]